MLRNFPEIATTTMDYQKLSLIFKFQLTLAYKNVKAFINVADPTNYGTIETYLNTFSSPHTLVAYHQSQHYSCDIQAGDQFYHKDFRLNIVYTTNSTYILTPVQTLTKHLLASIFVSSYNEFNSTAITSYTVTNHMFIGTISLNNLTVNAITLTIGVVVITLPANTFKLYTQY